jgi:putative two-component system response regulator
MIYPTLPINGKRILVVEDNSHVRQSIAQALEIEGYIVQQAQDGAGALKYIQNLVPNLIISEFHTPRMSGLDFYQAVRQNPRWVAIPFIFLTSSVRPEDIQRGRELGVEDYLSKPIDPDNLVKIVNARLLRAAQVQVALINEAYLETVNVLANTIEGRDPYTHGHVERVSTYALWLAEALDWPEENLRLLRFGARLHDIGKIIVPDNILKKPGGLSPEERELMEQHPVAGARILRNIQHLQAAEPYVMYHHERWDGSGYPEGLKGRDIPIEGRLLAIADVFDALTTDRPYHPAWNYPQVFEYLTQHAGTHFDPDLTPIFLQVIQSRLKERNA